jgi:regulator of protease activity HflC (stomatin/prohibitin superfamily)
MDEEETPKPKRKLTVKKTSLTEKEVLAELERFNNLSQPTALSMVKDAVKKTMHEEGITMEKLNIKRLAGIAVLAISIIIALFCLPQVFETVDSTEYVIKQAAFTGMMTCQNEPGMFLQAFGKINAYNKTGTFYFSEDNIDGGDGVEADPLPATFQGNSKATVSGYLKYRLSSVCDKQTLMHSEYGNQESVQMDLIRNAISAALAQTGPLFTAEEANIDRRPEFTSLVREILTDGIFLTVTTTEYSKLEGADSSNIQQTKVTRMFLDSTGHRVITNASVLKRYGIEVIALDIKKIKFDAKTQELMDAKKNAEQQRIAAKALAEKSKQDAITEREQGAARVARSKADQDVIKMTEVTQAEKLFEVARLAALTSIEEAKKVKAAGEAEEEDGRGGEPGPCAGPGARAGRSRG